MGIFSILVFFFGFIQLASTWSIYEKAGQPGFACIIPIYNLIVYMRIIGLSPWWLLLLFIPYFNLLCLFYPQYLLSESFGKPIWFAVGLIFLPLIFYPILGFGSAKYKGPAWLEE